ALARKIGHFWLIGGILSEQGEVYLKQQEFYLASTAFQESQAMALKVGAQEWIATALYGLARIAIAQGYTALGQHQGTESLDIFKAIGHRKEAEVAQWLTTLQPITQ